MEITVSERHLSFCDPLSQKCSNALLATWTGKVKGQNLLIITSKTRVPSRLHISIFYVQKMDQKTDDDLQCGKGVCEVQYFRVLWLSHASSTLS